MGVPGTPSQSRLGRYELVARLATGGMGEIFLARLEGAEGFEKLYVVKRILAHLADDARFRQMLIAEARIASKMSHPNICQVFELGDAAGQLYIVMEYLEGISLLPLLRRFSKAQKVLDLGFVGGVIQQTTDAMNYAHDLRDRDGQPLGIVHRDITPSNILLTESGVAKVLDFGIAKARGASAQTQEGTVKGKYAYMAPEQLRGGAVDRRADIFSLGVVLYEMLALRRLFQRKTDYLTFRAVMEQPIPDIRRYRADLPEGMADALIRALDRDPGVRFETARQFGAAILDGLGKRPWSQAEIGDFVCHHFADDIGQRRVQVTGAVKRSGTGTGSALSMRPLLTDSVDSSQADEEDEGFPAVETEVAGAPVWMPRPTPTTPQSAEFAPVGTPPPFGVETTGNARVVRLNPTATIATQRSAAVWPIVAIAMVVIAGGALFLVWQQTQKPTPPAEIKITQEPSDRSIDPGRGSSAVAVPDPRDQKPPVPAGSAVDDGSGATGGSAVGSGSAVTVKDPKPIGKPIKDPRAAYNASLKGHIGAMTRCLNDHRADVPSSEMMLSIKIGPDGHAKQVSLSPQSVDTGPLGRCIRGVILTVTFPKAAEDTDIAFPLRPKST